MVKEKTVPEATKAGPADDEGQVSYGFACIRRNPKGIEFIETASVSCSIREAQARANTTEFDEPNYGRNYPQVRIERVEIRRVRRPE
jgi:hypothetical protein